MPPPPVQRGIDHEREARQDYLTTKKAEVHLSRIKLFQKHSSFGASSDGRVIENENTG